MSVQGVNRIRALCYNLYVKCSEKSLIKLKAAARRFIQLNYGSIMSMLPADRLNRGDCSTSECAVVPFCIVITRVCGGKSIMKVTATGTQYPNQQAAISADKTPKMISAESFSTMKGFRACVKGEVRRCDSSGGCDLVGQTKDAAILVDILLAETAISAPRKDYANTLLVSESYDTEARGRLFRQHYESLRGEYFIFYSHGESHCRRMLNAMGFKETCSPAQEDIQYRPVERMAVMWCNGINSGAKRKSGYGYYVVNRLRYRGLIANKCSLARCLKEFEENHSKLVPAGLEAASFYPDTIHLNGSSALTIFNKIRSHHGLFLLKPGHTDCGEGIAMHRSNGSIDKLTDDLAASFVGFSHKDLIMQRYIDQPLLLGGRKFDLRVFLLLVPNQRQGAGKRGLYAFCHPGYVRLACRPYQLESDDPLIHLTNQAVQLRDPLYAQMKEDTVWSPDKLNSHLNSHLEELGVPCADWVRQQLYPRIRAILSHVLSITSSSLCNQTMSFELMGCDFIIDANFNVWLLEINSDPSLNKSTQTLNRIVTQVAEEAIGLSVEVLQRAARGRSVKHLATLQDFRKIFSHTNESTLRRVLAEAGLSYPEYQPAIIQQL